jgi:uncharacterized protein
MAAPPVAAAATSTPVTLVTQTRVLPAHAAEFAAWQQRVNDAIASVPGFIDHQVIPPDPPAQVDWVIVQKFSSLAAARAWLSSPQREQLLADIQGWLVGQDDIHIVTGDEQPQSASVSAVISTRILPGQEEQYRAWQSRIVAAESRFPGFEGSKLEPPIPGVQDDWVSIVRFDSDEHLAGWLDSADRQRLIAEAAPFTASSHVRTVRTGFDAWFQTTGGAAPPPAWKQNMLVLLALYPSALGFSLLVQGPLFMQRLGMPFWLAFFAGNAVGVLILSKLVPWVSHRFNWWINPAGGDTQRVNAIGVAVIVALYAVLLLFFSQVS